MLAMREVRCDELAHVSAAAAARVLTWPTASAHGINSEKRSKSDCILSMEFSFLWFLDALREWVTGSNWLCLEVRCT